MNKWLWLLLVLLLTNCSVWKKLVKSHDRETVKKIETVTTGKEVTQLYGDVLTGGITFPPLSSKPIHFPIESRGQKLDLYITDKGLEYRAEAKPIAMTSKETATSHTDLKTDKESSHKERNVEKKGFWFPWWGWILIVIAIVVFVVWKYVKPTVFGRIITAIKNLLKT